jgi:putative DNA methylase
MADGASKEYCDAIATYLAFAVDRTVDRWSTICTWDNSPKMEALRNTFARQAIPMTWDFAEANPFSESSGSWMNNVAWVAQAVAVLGIGLPGKDEQLDACG